MCHIVVSVIRYHSIVRSVGNICQSYVEVSVLHYRESTMPVKYDIDPPQVLSPYIILNININMHNERRQRPLYTKETLSL